MKKLITCLLAILPSYSAVICKEAPAAGFIIVMSSIILGIVWGYSQNQCPKNIPYARLATVIYLIGVMIVLGFYNW